MEAQKFNHLYYRMEMNGNERAFTIRQPATANLMLDSADRDSAVFPLANRFQISKNQSLFNGFFNRIGTSEIVLEWFTPNIAAAYGNNTFSIDLSGGAGVTGDANLNVVLDDGFRTQADIVDLLKDSLDTAGATLTPAVTFTITQTTTGVSIDPDQPVYISFGGIIPQVLGFPTVLELYDSNNNEGLPVGPTDLRAIRYLDFVSAQLTYNQDLKDASTAPIVRDVLARWYMAWEEPPPNDAYGFPILMGYQPFVCRRIFNPPKQIRWDNIQPLGNLAFEVFNNLNNRTGTGPAFMTDETNWLMTLQVSEN